MKRLLILALGIFLLSSMAHATPITWTSGGDGKSWSDLNNWSPKQVPTLNDDVTIGSSFTVTVSGNPAGANTVACTGTLIINGTLRIAATSSFTPHSSVGRPYSGRNRDHYRALDVGGGIDWCRRGQREYQRRHHGLCPGRRLGQQRDRHQQRHHHHYGERHATDHRRVVRQRSSRNDQHPGRRQRRNQ